MIKKNIKYFNDDKLDYLNDKILRRILKQYLHKLLIDKILRVLSINNSIDFYLKQIQFNQLERDLNEIQMNLIQRD